MNARLKSVAVWGGRAILLVALVFVAFEMRTHWTGVASWRPSGTDLVVLFTLAVFYGLSLYLLAEGWHRIVTLFAGEPRTRTFPSFTMTQIAKYLPGNVAHLIGRGIYLRGNAVSDAQIVKATLIELMVIPAGAAVALLCLGSSGLLSPLFPWVSAWMWGALTLTVVAAVSAGAYYGLKTGLFPRAFSPALPVSTGLATLFMLLLGITFAAIFNLLSPSPIAPLAGAAVLAWLIGFLTPGAPGGIGTREAALIALLWFLNQEDAVLLAAALFRVVTTLGDVVLFLTGWLVFPNRTAQEKRLSS